MEARVLALDVGYQPIGHVSWRKAINWIIEKHVEVIDADPDRYIRSPSWECKLPSVVRFLQPRHKKRAVKFSRRAVYARDGMRCQYCGRRYSSEQLTYDHVIPKSKGGKTTWTNIVSSCMPCNQRKAGRTPEQAGMTLLSAPVKPKKLPEMPNHIRWVEGNPLGWRQWLKDAVRDSVYWDGKLDEDE